MTEQTIYIKTPISRDDLDAVITGLEVACGGIRIQVSEGFDLVVTNERQAAALKILFGSDDKFPVEGIKETKKPKIPPESRASRKVIYYTFLTGERVFQQITGGALGNMLKAGKLEPGTRLSHPTKGELVVRDDGQRKFSLAREPKP